MLENLQLTSAELADANEKVKKAMAAAQLHNQILRARDMELHTQNARFDAALNNMSQALCLVDAQSRLIECNVRFLELFGVARTAARPGALMQHVFQAVSEARRDHGRMIEFDPVGAGVRWRCRGGRGSSFRRMRRAGRSRFRTSRWTTAARLRRTKTSASAGVPRRRSASWRTTMR